MQLVLNKNIVVAGFFLLVCSYLYGQTDTIAQRIVLIGDGGELTKDKQHPVANAVKKFIPLDNKTTVLFLGDNLYSTGLPDSLAKNYTAARAVLDSQLSIVEGTKANAIMIPGNHDWLNGGRGGYDAIIREQLYVTFLLKPNIRYEPEDGCPGPVEIPLADDVTLIAFDSQWWLHQYDKPEIESDCKCKSKDELVTQIRDIAVKNSKKLIILACHHPFKSHGPHGGYFTLRQHLFPLADLNKKLMIPLPVLGSVYPLSRGVFGSPQDLKHPNYANMIDEITNAVTGVAKNVVFVAGHEHNLELIREGNYNYIISGGGCKTNPVSKSKGDGFSTQAEGFAVMEVSTNKNVTINFYTVLDSVRKVYTSTLLNFSPANVKDTITSEIIAAINLPDSVTRPASNLYPKAHGLKKLFLGQNYRPEWSTPVRMKTFDIDKERGGFIVSGVGGGSQTKTLRLNGRDSTIREWVLRRIEKSTIALPAPFNTYLATGATKELVSASHPYGALIVPGLANPLGIVVPQPQLFFIEDDPRLRGYKNDFSGKASMLEDGFTTYRGKKTQSTSKVFNEMLKDNDHRPDQPAVLKARLLDMLIGDFDRHFDQWRWYTRDTGEGKVYYPIPRDRDQAFFFSDGILTKLFSGRSVPFLKGFRPNIPDVDWLSYTAKDFDRIFLTDLDAGDWEKTIRDFQSTITDSTIRNAVKKLPPEIFAIDGERLIRKLVARRNIMNKEGLSYYKFISKKVNIIGSNQKEYFKVSNYGEGLQVRVYERGRGNDTSFIMYDRIFDPSITKEIRLYGLSDDDVFDVEENAVSRIKLRIIGGNGNDTFDIKGNIENLLYDRKSDLNVIRDSSHSKNRFTVDPPTSSRNLLGFDYNRTNYPLISFGYNTDDKFIIGAGISRRTYGFRNFPYATDQRLYFMYSSLKAYQLQYRGEFNHISRNADLLVNARFSSPALKNFFGLGNNVIPSPGKSTDFYRTRYKDFEIEALLRHRYFEKLHASFGPYFYYYNNTYSDNSNKILGQWRTLGLDSADIFSKKMYAGLKAIASFDNRNDMLFPTRGILWKNEFLTAVGLTSSSDRYSKLTSDMTIYASQREPARVIAKFRVGFGHIFGKSYEYFQALDLGADNNLQGFRKNRYLGKSRTYASLELRIKAFELKSVLFPGPVGLIGFVNAGRVGLKDIHQKNWHGAIGGGVYYIPFNLFFISATAGFSGNEKIYNISVGSKINLTF
ncbi:MAG: BamA/TamA family outer membrane protein [Chitinophagaceae bacterium]|nr:BamA/TamA family outer membrane protein [Chitinophagaceae bacterium]